MTKPVFVFGATIAAMTLTGCDSGSGRAPGAVSEGEAQALEEAAEMLDERRLPEGTLPPTPQEELAAEPAQDTAQEEPAE